MIVSLTGCHTLNGSIRKSRKHRISAVETKTQTRTSTAISDEWDAPETNESIVDHQNVSAEQRSVQSVRHQDEEVLQSDFEQGASSVAQEQSDAPESSNYNEYGEATDEELAARKKYDKFFWYILITSVIGAPVATAVGFLTFNPAVFLAIAVPFLLGSLALALIQIYRIAPTVPDKLVDKKYQRRYIYADVVLVVVCILIGVALLGLFSRLV